MKEEIKEILKRYQIHPQKSLGQNFIVDQKVIDRLVKEAELKGSETVLEVGPGLGTLTRELAESAERVVAVELSRSMARVCQSELKAFRNIEIINQDILKIDLSDLALGRNYKVVSSLPYQITSPFLRKMVKTKAKPKLIVLMVQQELAERIAALPGNSARGFLSVLVQTVFQPEIAQTIPQSAFYPQPRVRSAILKLAPLQRSYLIKDLDRFSGLVQAGFSQKRKKLINSLANQMDTEKEIIAEKLRALGLAENLRAENLSVEDWLKLSQELKS